MTLDATTQNLIETMVSEFVTTGKVVLPPGRREEVVALLTRLMVNGGLCDAYCRAVTGVRKQFGVDLAMDKLAGDGDIPELQIARHGFSGLTDEQLADYTTDPDAINAIFWRFDDDDLFPELGHWFWLATDSEMPPEYREAADRAVAAFRRLERETRPGSENSSSD